MKLLDEIMQEKENKTIVFTETKRRADELTRRMRREGYVIFLFCCELVIRQLLHLSASRQVFCIY